MANSTGTHTRTHHEDTHIIGGITINETHAYQIDVRFGPAFSGFGGEVSINSELKA